MSNTSLNAKADCKCLDRGQTLSLSCEYCYRVFLVPRVRFRELPLSRMALIAVIFILSPIGALLIVVFSRRTGYKIYACPGCRNILGSNQTSTGRKVIANPEEYPTTNPPKLNRGTAILLWLIGAVLAVLVLTENGLDLLRLFR